METYILVNNKELLQYEYHIGDEVALMEYITTPKGEVYLTHTEVPPALQGRGIASRLIEDVLIDLDNRHLRVVPVCPFVIAYISRHPEWQWIVVNKD